MYPTYADIPAAVLDRLPATDKNTDAEKALILRTVNAMVGAALSDDLKAQEQKRLAVLTLQERVLVKQNEVWVQAFSQHNQQIMLMQRIARALEKQAGILEPDLIPTEEVK